MPLMHIRYSLLIISLLIAFTTGWSQTGNYVYEDQPAPQIHIKRTVDAIVLDGKLSEASWHTSTLSTNFTQYFPTDSVVANGETELYFTYDKDHIYLAAKCYTAGNDFLVAVSYTHLTLPTTPYV